MKAAAAVASAALTEESAAGFDGNKSAMDHDSSFGNTSSSSAEAQDEFLQTCLHMVQVSKKQIIVLDPWLPRGNPWQPMTIRVCDF